VIPRHINDWGVIIGSVETGEFKPRYTTIWTRTGRPHILRALISQGVDINNSGVAVLIGEAPAQSLAWNIVRGTFSRLPSLGGIDQLLHGDDHLRGWGATPFMDGTLYQVRGFDATARRYIYQVNPRFGNTSPSASTLRSPFRMTLDVRMNLGHDAQEQDVILKMRVKPALKGTRASADTLKNRYMNSTSSNAFMDIYKLMLRYADSLALSRDQSEKVQARQKLLIARADSVFGGLAGYLAKLPESYSAKDAAKHVTDAATAMWDIIYAEGPWIKELLTPGQLRLLPGGLREMVTTPGFKGRFFYSLGP